MRERMKRALQSIPIEQLRSRSAQMCRRVLDLPAMQAARTIMVYAPLLHEADAAPIAAAWFMVGEAEARHSGAPAPRRVCVPRMNWTDRTMEPALVTDWDNDFVLNRIGLREPRSDLVVIPLSELDAVIVPGLAFDHAGRRLGRGGGFYDRFLPRLHPRVLTIGVCLREQIVPHVPIDPIDIPVRVVISDEGVLGGRPQA